MEGMSTPTGGMLIGYHLLRGHPMASASPPQVAIRQYRYGMQRMEATSTSIVGILMLCWGWPGRPMVSTSFLEAGISIVRISLVVEEATQPRRCGMQQM